MGSHLQRRTVTFIVRIWAEYLEQMPAVWRGEVEVAESRERTRFRSLAEMTACIEGRLRQGLDGCGADGDGGA